MLKILCVCGAVVAALAGGAAQAVTVTAEILGPSDLVVGETQRYMIVYAISGAPQHDSTSGSATIALDGVTFGTVALNPNGGTLVLDLAVDTPGNAELSVTGTITYSRWVQEVIGSQTYAYSCGNSFRPRTCYGSYPVFGWVMRTVGIGTLDARDIIAVSAPMSTVPLPAGGALLLGAMASFGLVRRRARAAASAA